MEKTESQRFVDIMERGANISHAVKKKLINLNIGTSWSGSGPYTQRLTIAGYTVTRNTMIDLNADKTTIATLSEFGVWGAYVYNNNGTLTLYVLGEKPTAAFTVQATLFETDTI